MPFRRLASIKIKGIPIMVRKSIVLFFSSVRGIFALSGIVSIVFFVFILSTTRLNFNGNLEGMYLLKGENGYWFELKDDIYLGEYERVLFKSEIVDLVFSKNQTHSSSPGSHVRYKWHTNSGSGFILNSFPDNKKLLMAFGRFLDSEGLAPKGMFVGGGLPYSEYEHESVMMNETGMAYYDGSRWLHLWCNANESITSIFSPEKPVFPSHWKYLGSKVIHDHKGEIMIRSSHEIDLSGAPFLMDRYVFYRAGDQFFTLVMTIKNIGQSVNGYFYIYGDEPWVGKFGTSEGNIGWTKGKLYNYEGPFDTTKNTYAGMYDYGNTAIPGKQYLLYSGAANFIQWMGGVRPDFGYFSNQPGSFTDENRLVPLASPDNRVIFLQWGPRSLLPGQSESIILAIGMANTNSETGMPVKPDLKLEQEYIEYIISHSERSH